MEQRRQPSVLRRLSRAVHVDADAGPRTEAMLVVDQTHSMHVLDLSMRLAEQLLLVGASSNDVAVAVQKVTRAYGLRPVHFDVTYNSIAVSYHRGDDHDPLTLVRVVRAPLADFAKLQRLQTLVVEVVEGLPLERARAQFTAVKRMPFAYRPWIVTAAHGLLASGVAVMFGSSWVIGLITFIASIAASSTQRGLAALKVPYFFSQIGGALVVTLTAVGVAALADAGIVWFAGLQPSIIIAAGIVLMLSGVAVVGAAQDAIDGFSLTAGGRMLDIGVLTLGVVVGILAGLQLAKRLGVDVLMSADAPQLGGFASQVVGAIVIAVAVAVMNGAGAFLIVLSGIMGAIGWAGAAAGLAVDLDASIAAALGSMIASFIGIIVAHRLHVPSLALSTAGFMPLVPGGAVFRGLLQIVESNGSSEAIVAGTATLAEAGSVGLGIAAGASLGLFLGAPVRDTLALVVRGRRRTH